MLVERAAQVNVHQLQAAADGEHRDLAAKRLGEKIALHSVARVVGRVSLRAPLLTVTRGIYVDTAGEQQSIEGFQAGAAIDR
jgi:hypothetical protein